MPNHLAVQPHGELPSLANRLLQLLYLLCDDAIDYLWTLLTKKSRLERLLERSESLRAAKILEIEEFLVRKLSHHSNKVFRRREDYDTILAEGSVTAKGERRDELRKRLETVVATIDAYEELKAKVESTRREKYDSNNPSHEEKLRDLWRLLMPHEVLEDRLGKQWRFIGFQGDDPATDFRGMGILSLDQLIYMAKHHQDEAVRLLNISHHPTTGFPLAVAGITFTAVSRHLLCSGKLKKLFYRNKDRIDMDLFNETYCTIFFRFADFWQAANPASVMDFNPVRASFERKLIDELGKESCDIGRVC